MDSDIISNPSLRTATEQDAASMARLHNDCFAKPWTLDDFTRLLANDGVYSWILSGMRDDIGFALLQTTPDDAEILTLCVHPAWQRRGLAHSMITTIIQHCRRLSLQKIFLEVRADNIAAQNLYTHHGFIKTGTRPRYYDNSMDAVMMTYSLI